MTTTTPDPRHPPRRRPVLGIVNAVGAAVVCVVVLVIATAGYGAVPAVGRLLDPGTGVWTDARNAGLPTDESITVPGMSTKTTVTFDATGVAHVIAGSDADFFRALGYVEARFRLFQMDLMRRQAGGALAQILGTDALQSDEFELDIGLRRDAQRDWAQLPASAPAHGALVDFASGANSAIDQMKRDNSLPMYFAVLGYQPAHWTPVDSLLVQRLETQTLALDDSPLSYSNVASGLGPELFEKWFHAAPQNPQHPFDPGPYTRLPLTPLTTSDPAAPSPTAASTPTRPATKTGSTRSGTAQPSPTPAGKTATPARTSTGRSNIIAGSAQAANNILSRMAQLPFDTIHDIGNSNEWVVSGRRTASGQAILASDPHLKLSLPSFWFEFTARSPSYQMGGVGLAGIPVVLIGRTPKISWGITNSQHGSTYYYLERTAKSHPDQYFWRGAWQPMKTISYAVKVKGQATVKHDVRLTVHGPVMSLQGVTTSVWWTGSLPSDDLDAMLQVVKATDFTQFRQALSGWHTPSEDFAYADSAGNVGIANAGYAPQVASGKAWLPLSGTGESDVVGSVAHAALPYVYNPPSGVAASANQREVGTSYPYYWGRGTAFFDQGWRTAEILRGLQGDKITVADTEKLQLSSTDGVARALVPTLLAALRNTSLDRTQRAAVRQLSSWNVTMAKDSAAASVWAAVIPRFDSEVWKPIAAAYHIKTPPDFPRNTAQGVMVNDAIRGMLVTLAATDPGNAVFAPPGKAGRTATDVLRSAFRQGVADLVRERGADPSRWLYGSQHSVMISSTLANSTLDAGPFPSAGDGLSINAIISPIQERDGKKLVGVNIGGASYRFVMDWATNTAYSSLPGGTSENAASPWYANRVKDWLDGRYDSVLDLTTTHPKGKTWTLHA